MIGHIKMIALGVICAAVSLANAATLKGEDPKQNARLAKEWAAVAELPNFWEGTWQAISPLYYFPGPVAYTPETAEYVKNYKPTDDTVMANCAMPGMPFVMNQGAMPIKFYPAPGTVTMYIESYANSRFFYTDGRSLSENLNPTFLGTSIARWEGDTLVVDSRGFVEDTLLQIGALPPIPGTPFEAPIFKKHGPSLRFVERMRMPDYKSLEIATTIYDDTIFAKPYTSTRVWHRYTGRNSEPQEWVCSNNLDFYDPESGKLEYNVKDKAITTQPGAADKK
jgi:hypothetical protein